MNEWISMLFSLTLSGSMIFAAAVVVRYVFGRQFPKWFLCCLWLPVLFGFLFPLGSRYSLISGLKGEQETAVVAEGYSVFVQEEIAPSTEQYSLESISPTGANAHDPYDFLLPLWLCGTMIMTVWKLVGYHRFCGRMLSAVRFPEEWEESMLRRLSGNERVPRLLHSTEAQGPVLIGVGKCTIFLPDITYPPEVLEDVLAHELSHRRRHDLAFKWLGAFVKCIHWFNPVCWWLSGLIDRDCELACDEQVLKNQNSERCRRYGRTLVLVAAGQAKVQSLTASMYSQKQRLKERLEFIMNNKKFGRHITIVLCIATLWMGLSTMLLGVYAGNMNDEESADYERPLESESTEISETQDAMEQTAPLDSPIVSKEQSQYIWPLETDDITISATFNSRVNPNTGETISHNGIDLKADSGVNVLAVDGGVVITSAFDGSYGEYVVISHEDGRTTLYANMLHGSRNVAEGDAVAVGQVIGQVGSTGLSTGPHLHFELWQDGVAVNPLDFLPVN